MAKPMMKPPMRGMPMKHATPKPPPPPMPKAQAPVPMGGVGPGAGVMGAMPQAQAPQGYATGTRDVAGQRTNVPPEAPATFGDQVRGALMGVGNMIDGQPGSQTVAPAMIMNGVRGMGAGLPGYAWGTADTSGGAGRPIPGLSSQAGSWTGPVNAPPPPPEEPKGAVPLGLSTLRSLGQRAKPQGYASGTPDVSGGGSEFNKPEMTNPEPTPGYDPQTGSYPALDEGFVAHLRAAMGMPPKVQKFAGGTPNVGPAPLPPQPGVLDSLISGSLGPLQVGSTATYAAPDDPINHQMPAPNEGPPIAMPAGQFGRNAPASNAGPPVTPPTLAQMMPAAGSTPPEVVRGRTLPQQNPTFGSMIQGLLNVPQTMVAHPDGTVKTPPDPHLNDAVSKATGASPEVTNAMLNPHHYTQDEFVNALTGVPIAVVEKLWNMQHYLTPQQQVEGAYSKQLQAGVDTAAQELQNAQKTNTPAGKLRDFEAALAKQQAEQARHRQVVTEGQGAYYQQPSQ